MKIPLQRTYFNSSEERAVARVLRSGWVTQGSKVLAFEDLFCQYTGAKYAVATTSATSALFLSLYCLGVGKGDEVIVPSLSFIATANVVVHTGAKPVFVDVDSRTYNMDPDRIEKKINKNTRAIIPVDQVGLPCELDEIAGIAKKHKLYIIEDAACALGSIYKNRKIGSFEHISCFSFHPRKPITTGEGGMITTQDKKTADKLRTLRHQGMSVSDLARHKAKRIVISEGYPIIGYNFRLSDIQAAVGVEQMKKLPKVLSIRARLAQRYTRYLSCCKSIVTPFVPDYMVHNCQTYVIRLIPNKKITRDLLMKKMFAAGVSVRVGIMASHLELPYKEMYPSLALPETESAARETIALPLYPQMTYKEQDYVIEKLLKFV